ncbi:MAG: hypothetical protein WCW25_04405 [Patescibacteria group bacterium]|jgi:hypothetical protein
MSNKSYKFRGGMWSGILATTWPFITLEINKDYLILHNELLQRDYLLSKKEVIKIELKNYIPFIANGIRIYHANKNYDEIIIFWVFRLNKLIETLKETGWLDTYEIIKKK